MTRSNRLHRTYTHGDVLTTPLFAGSLAVGDTIVNRGNVCVVVASSLICDGARVVACAGEAIGLDHRGQPMDVTRFLWRGISPNTVVDYIVGGRVSGAGAQ